MIVLRSLPANQIRGSLRFYIGVIQSLTRKKIMLPPTPKIALLIAYNGQLAAHT